MGNIERWSEDELKRTLAIADGIDAEGFGATAGTLRDLVFEIRRLRTTNRGAVSLLEDMAACARDAQNAEVGMDIERSDVIDDAVHEINMRWQEGEQGDDYDASPLPQDLVRETAEAIVDPLLRDLKGAVDALRVIANDTTHDGRWAAGRAEAALVAMGVDPRLRGQ